MTLNALITHLRSTIRRRVR